MDLNYDGLIIESHRNPDEAWSDASQQLTPDALAEMLNSIEFRKATYGSDFQSELDNLRERLDNLDRELLEVLASRMSVVEQLGEYKRDNNVAVLQLNRWKQVHESRADWAKSLNLYPEVVEELFKLIHMESIRKQTEVMNQQNA
jgi:chorismate mutase